MHTTITIAAPLVQYFIGLGCLMLATTAFSGVALYIVRRGQ